MLKYNTIKCKLNYINCKAVFLFKLFKRNEKADNSLICFNINNDNKFKRWCCIWSWIYTKRFRLAIGVTKYNCEIQNVYGTVVVIRNAINEEVIELIKLYKVTRHAK